MLYFINDYSEGMAPQILDVMISSNMSKQSGYGDDEFCISAKEKIKKNRNGCRDFLCKRWNSGK